MRKTPFAGLTVIEPDNGDSIYTDGGSFLTRNPEITDKLLRVGALTHRHDGHAALATPAAAAAVVAVDVGGTLLGSTRLYVGYTALDDNGGETILSPVADATTPPPLAAPGAPVLAVDYAAGELRPGAYRYAISVTDGRGGETLVGTPAEVLLAYGQPAARVTISGLAGLLDAVGGDGWRLYRSIAGAPWAYLTYGTGDVIVDDGSLCVDCTAMAPSANSTQRTGAITVTVPALPAGATGFRLYASTTPVFTSPSLVGDFTAADAAADVLIFSTTFAPGAPPAITTSVGGAARLDPEAELEDFHWRRPVPTAAALPAGALGDVRLTLDTHALWVHDGDAWTGPINAGPTVTDATIGAVVSAKALNFAAGTGIGIEVTEPTPGSARILIVNTATGAGGGTPGVRANATATTAALAALASQDLALTLGKTFALLRVASDVPARIRLYSSAAKRDADAGRPQTQTPTGNHGLICEVITTADQLSWDLSPMVLGADLQAIPDGVIAARVENRGAPGAAITVTATHVPIET